MISLIKFEDNKIIHKNLILIGIANASGYRNLIKFSDDQMQKLMEYKFQNRIENDQYYFLIKSKDMYVGSICIGFEKDVLTINDFAIFIWYRRNGLGKETLNYIIKKHKDFNIELGVEKQNKIAFNLYTSLGFKIFKEFDEGYYLRLEKQK